MSTPNAGSDEFNYEMMGNVTTYLYDGNGELIRVGDTPRKPRPVEPEHKLDVVYDRARHVIKITRPGGKTAEFEDRPLRFLVMDRNPDGFGVNHEKHEMGKRERG